MWHVLSWLLVFGCVALWSLLAWAFHGLGAWALTQAGGVANGTGTWDGFKLPDWLAPWVPADYLEAVTATVAAFGPSVQALLGFLPAFEGAWTVAAWVIWGLGVALLVVIGLLLSMVITLMRRGASAALPAPATARSLGH